MSDIVDSKSFIARTLQIPCFRRSFLYGIGGGIASGLLYFMFTSKPRMATHVGVGSYFCLTVTIWTYCRYQMVKAEEKRRLFKIAVQQKLLAEGTEHDWTKSNQTEPSSNSPAPDKNS